MPKSEQDGASTTKVDYRSTLQLPSTAFPMKADLPRREPEIQRAWAEDDLYGRIRQARAGQPKFILHDGPPFVNGNVHMGTALNKSLKDFIVRYATMRGLDAPNVPGWDAHGLPVEWQALRQHNLRRTPDNALEVRLRCHEFAASFLGRMTAQFTRLGILADWDHPYVTYDPAFEAEEIAVFGRMVGAGLVFRGLRPVYWCPECQTALADAEVEFKQIESPAITVLFPVIGGAGLPEGTSAAIWTTTPWTLPANVAVAAHPGLEYVVVDSDRGPVLLAATCVAATFAAAAREGIHGGAILMRLRGSELEGIRCRHPFLDRESPVVLADYVTAGEGTGLVHTAPGHGREDFDTGRRYGLPVIQPLDDRGRFLPDTGAGLAGLSHAEAEPHIIGLLRERGRLLAADTLRHEYAHCWRSRNPVVWRATEQWFCDMNALREPAMAAARQVHWQPAWGEQRMLDMLRTRTDWCLSRQRVWGVPIPILHCVACGHPLLDERVVAAVSEIVRVEGADAWWRRPAADFLPDGCACAQCGAREVRKDPDTLDVWFDSGTTHAAVLAQDPRVAWPADLYLEGPDQYRGWFQSSLLTSAATTGKPPYRGILTHGWVLDGQGRAMHKSLGNAIEPSQLLDRWGVDVLRLWVASVDYSSDVRVSEEIMAQVGEVYRKVRNTVRFLLGNLGDLPAVSEAAVTGEGMPDRDRWALWRLAEFLHGAAEGYEGHRYHAVYHLLQEFCVQDLSGFYLDLAKDRLYCDRPDAPDRRATQAVLYEVARALVAAVAPITPHTADEAWSFLPRRPGDPDSVHLSLWPDAPAAWSAWAERGAPRWEAVLRMRSEVSRAAEVEIAAGRIGKLAEASARVTLPAGDLAAMQPLRGEWADLAQVASVRCQAGQAWAAEVQRTDDPRCDRCWRYRPAVAAGLCERCAGVVGARR